MIWMSTLAFLFPATCTAAWKTQPGQFRPLGSIKVHHPAFLTVGPLRPGEPPSLIISSFGLLTEEEQRESPERKPDAVWIVRNVGASLGDPAGIQPIRVSDSVVWPNEAVTVHRQALGVDGILVAGGFLVPGRSSGAISFLPLPGEPQGPVPPVTLSPSKPGWFFHRTEWRDIDGDGRLDIVTARATKPVFGRSKGELLWLEQPHDEEGGVTGSRPLDGPWTEHIVTSGPDVHFQLADLDRDGREEVVATQFFSRRLALYWWNTAGDLLRDGSPPVAGRVIDDRLGAAFDVQVIDLDGDGREDLLVTNHESDRSASVFAYEIPADIRTGTFQRRTLLTGIETTQPGINQASPGQARAFWPTRDRSRSARPWILVSGDGSQKAHLLTPALESPGDWGYEESILVRERSTIGQSAIADVDGDGRVEVFVPAYDRGLIHVFTFEP